MDPNIQEVTCRIRALREDLGITMQEMAAATGRSLAEYAAQESGEQDLSFTFLSAHTTVPPPPPRAATCPQP